MSAPVTQSVNYVRSPLSSVCLPFILLFRVVIGDSECYMSTIRG